MSENPKPPAKRSTPAKVAAIKKSVTLESIAEPPPAPTKSPKAATSKKVPPIIPATPSPKHDKPRKLKVVRDSFTMPEDEYAHIAAIKARCLAAGVSVKKSEVLRAALASLSQLSDTALTATISKVAPIKTGRPAKS